MDPRLQAFLQWMNQRKVDPNAPPVTNPSDLKMEIGPALTAEQFQAYCQASGIKPTIVKQPSKDKK